MFLTTGYSKQEYSKLAADYAVTQAAIDQFFATIGQRNVRPEEVGATLQKWADEYKVLEKRIKDSPVRKADEIRTQTQAIAELEAGNLYNARELAKKLPTAPRNLRVR